MGVTPHAEDPYRQAVYDWENTWYDWNRNTLTLAQCRRLIRRACERYKVTPPRVRQHKRASMTYSIPEHGVISLQAADRNGYEDRRGGKNPATALHEAAHIITHALHPRSQDHGPTFLGIYMWLLDKNAIAPPLALHVTARKHGLRWKVEAP